MFNKDLIFLDTAFSDKHSFFSEIADILYEQGYVDGAYKAALINREANFPTGLALDHCGIAIPHTEAKYIKKPGIAFVRLAQPIEFQEMATNRKVEVKLVFLLLVNDKKKQVGLLSQLIGTFQNERFINSLLHVEEKVDALEIFNEYFGSNDVS